MRRLVLAMSAVAVLLLGLEKVGAYHIVPGGETGFECTPLGGSGRIPAASYQQQRQSHELGTADRASKKRVRT